MVGYRPTEMSKILCLGSTIHCEVSRKAPKAKDFTLAKAFRHRALSAVEIRDNKTQSKVRPRVEHAFVVIKKIIGWDNRLALALLTSIPIKLRISLFPLSMQITDKHQALKYPPIY